MTLRARIEAAVLAFLHLTPQKGLGDEALSYTMTSHNRSDITSWLRRAREKINKGILLGVEGTLPTDPLHVSFLCPLDVFEEVFPLLEEDYLRKGWEGLVWERNLKEPDNRVKLLLYGDFKRKP